AIFTRRGCDRVVRYAFELALTRPRRHVTSATKSNGIIHSMPFWDERFAAIATAYPSVATAHYHIDILAAHFVQHPDWFNVVVAAIERLVEEGKTLTRDLGGRASTTEVGRAIAALL